MQPACALQVYHHRRRFWHATLRLRNAIRRYHPPQRVVLSQSSCIGERKVLFQIMLDGAEPRDARYASVWHPLNDQQ